MLNKFIAMILVFCLCAPMAAIADTPPLPFKPRIMGLKYGQKAPFTGVLLNSVAASKLFVDKEFLEEQHRLKLQFELAKQSSRLQLIIDSQKVSYDALEEKHKVIMGIKNKEIERLAEIAANKKDYSIWWGTGGIIVGIGLTIAVVYAVQGNDR